MKKGILLAFLGGIAVGGIIALLTAPEDGESTRRRIRKFVDDEKEKLMDFAESVKDRIEEGEERIEDAVEAIKSKARAARTKC